MNNLIPGLFEEVPEVVAPAILEQDPGPSSSAQLRIEPMPPTVPESAEEDLCKRFKQQTCGCQKLPGKKPCSDLFSVEHYLELRAQCSFLIRDELDLVLMGSIMCTVLRDEWVRDGRHKPVKRRKLVTMAYMHEANEVCKKTFCFLYGIGKDRLRLVKEHYLSNGLETRVHGNRKRLPHNYISIEAVNKIVKFLQNYTEENAILLPGRIPGYKRDDIKLLPSSCSKTVSNKRNCMHLVLY